MFLEEGRPAEIVTRTGRGVLAFQADRRRGTESFRQANNRNFRQHCLQEILRRRSKVEVTAVERLNPELIPTAKHSVPLNRQPNSHLELTTHASPNFGVVSGFLSGALDGGRTHNLSLRRAALYPVELRVQMRFEQ